MPDATALALAIAEGRVSARAAMAASLDAAGASTGVVARLLDRPSALAEAGRAPSGPFGGVPMLAKDLGAAARGLAPAAGSPALRGRLDDPAQDSVLFARFRRAGLVPMGLSAVPEFGLALSTEPPGAPPARNPFDAGLSAGGSSGGAAAAVALGIVAIAHATDAAGSIRVPAACCGLWGLKPSRGAIPGAPAFGNHLMGLASELVLARSLRDVRAALNAVADPVPARPLPSRPRIAVACADPARPHALQAAAVALAEAGCTVGDVPFPQDLVDRADALARLVLSVSLAEWLDALGIPDAEVSPVSAATAEEGRRLTGAAVFAAARDIARLSHEAAERLFGAADALLMPVLSGPPPRLGHFDPAESPGARFAKVAALAPGAALANVAGLPALALPFGMAKGLPVGLQLVGPRGCDHALLDIAARLAPPPVPYPAPIAGLAA